ncbi:hypothetical protein [Sandaracinus amylolyticus]|uniref:hypothetical protein n=1 Tax=Sandaracinus amylolyticus TaxID=927083 RepID=UPI001F4809B2|nr:hypothetical protein [Sandaracinus amylolyticus]
MTSLRISVLATACSPFPSADELESPACVDGDWNPTETVRASLGADFVAIVDDEEGVLGSGPRCDGATDPTACEEAISEALWSAQIVVRVGDEVTTPTMRELLGTIDSLDEALIVTTLSGYSLPGCGEGSRTGGRRIEGGWEVVVIGDVECVYDVGPFEHEDRYFRHLVHVSDDGELDERAREESHRDSCYDHCDCFE